MLRSLLLCSLLLAPPLFADTLSIPLGAQGDTRVALEEQQAIFTRFYRSPATSSGEGSGLGLPIVKRIVELHFGSIGLGKGLEGKGLEVQVFLPKTQPDATRPPARGPDSGRSHI